VVVLSFPFRKCALSEGGVIFTETKLKGAFLIEPEKRLDERGFFARTWCQHEFEAHGINVDWVQGNISFNRNKGTIRGMHYQVPPRDEDKLVRCTMGAIFDVIVDLRPGSKTLGHWTAVELTESNRLMLFVPRGMAHGFQTLVDDTEVCYEMSEYYHPEMARGLRWDDPTLRIQWPQSPHVISERDIAHLDFRP